MKALTSHQMSAVLGGDIIDDWIIICSPIQPDEPPFDPWIPGIVDPELPTPLPWIQEEM